MTWEQKAITFRHQRGDDDQEITDAYTAVLATISEDGGTVMNTIQYTRNLEQIITIIYKSVT